MNTLPSLQQLIQKELGIETLPETTRQEILLTLSEAILKLALVLAMDKLTPEDRARVEEIKDRQGYEEILKFFDEKIPDFSDILTTASTQVIADFKKQRDEARV